MPRTPTQLSPRSECAREGLHPEYRPRSRCRSHCFDEDDVAQEQRLCALRYGFRPPPKWAVHKLLARFYGRSRNQNAPKTARGLGRPHTSIRIVAPWMHDLMVRDAVQVAMAALNYRERNIVRWHFWDGESFTQLGARYGVTKQAVFEWMNSACAKMFERLTRDSVGGYGQ